MNILCFLDECMGRMGPETRSVLIENLTMIRVSGIQGLMTIWRNNAHLSSVPTNPVEFFHGGHEINDVFQRVGAQNKVNRIVYKRKVIVQVGNNVYSIERKAIQADEPSWFGSAAPQIKSNSRPAGAFQRPIMGDIKFRRLQGSRLRVFPIKPQQREIDRRIMSCEFDYLIFKGLLQCHPSPRACHVLPGG